MNIYFDNWEYIIKSMNIYFDRVKDLSENQKRELRFMIVSSSDTLGGRFRIINTRLSVDDMVRIYINNECDDYPHLDREKCFDAAILHIYEN